MSRIYTEIRIAHETKEIKVLYERKLDAAIKALGYKNRSEWLNSMYREAMIKSGDK
jgi:tetrahydromethanopterin S-methyltransferase subunit H